MSETSTLDELLDEQTSTEEAEETQEKKEEEEKEEITLEGTHQLAKAVQKGLTQNFQKASQMEQRLGELLEKIEGLSGNKQVSLDDGESYVTVSALRKELEAMQTKPLIEAEKMETLVNSTLDEARAQGLIETEEEERQFIDYALENNHKMDLGEALDRWQERKEVYYAAIQSKEKAQEKKELGAKVSSSERGGGTPRISWKEIQAMDLEDI